jgi:hypothetical protein
LVFGAEVLITDQLGLAVAIGVAVLPTCRFKEFQVSRILPPPIGPFSAASPRGCWLSGIFLFS